MSRLVAYLQLCRFAAVFTAMPDIFLGYLLVHPGIVSPRDFGLLLASSSCFYLAGMVFNDLFDREVDAVERPKRPIPSKRISVRAATVFGAVLIALGLALSTAGGVSSALIALLLTICIFLYDGVLKSSPVGPVVMGSCRFFNVLLGASTAVPQIPEASALAAVWTGPQIEVAGCLAVYIAGVTWFARHEAGTSSRGGLVWGLTVVNLGLALLVLFVMTAADLGDGRLRALLVLGLIALYLNRRMLGALFDPTAASVQLAVRTMLVWLILLDATIVFLAHPNRWYFAAVILLTVPAILLGRYLAIT